MKNKFLIPTMLFGSMFLAMAVASPRVANTKYAEASETNPDDEEVYAALASYQFQDSENPGKDSMGNYDLTTAGTVTAADGVATFTGAGALYSAELLAAIGGEDFTIAMTVSANGSDTTPLSMYTDYWYGGVGCGISTWGNNLRFSYATSDGVKLGDDRCWGAVLDSAAATEHRVVISLKHGEKVRAYCDGALKASADVPEGFTFAGSPIPFSLGGAVWGGATQAFKMNGTMKNVTVYKTAVNEVGALSLSKFGNLFKADVGDQKVVEPMSAYEFADAENPGKDSKGVCDLTKDGTVTAAEGVATFTGDGALYSSEMMNILGNEDFTLKLTVTANGSDTTPVSLYTDYWLGGVGLGVTTWGNNLRVSYATSAGVQLGDDRCWGGVVGQSCAEEHTVIISLKVGGKLNVWGDGELKATKDVPADWSLSGSPIPFSLGGAVWGGATQAFKMNGTMKDVRIYKSALGVRAISELFAFGEAYENANNKVISVDLVDLSSTIKVPSDASDELIINGYAPVGKQEIVCNMQDGSTKKAKVTWDAVEVVEGVKMLKGTLSDVLNPDDIHAYAKIGFVDGAIEILPIAKYEFASSEEIGKDSMGRYDLTVVNKKVYNEEGKQTGEETPTVKAENGAAVFDGKYSLMNKELAKEIKFATVSFDMQLDGSQSHWQSPLSFGRDGENPHAWNIFEVETGNTQLRYGCCTELDELTGHSNIDFQNKGEQNYDWYPVIGELGTKKNNVTLVAGDNNHLKVYLNNTLCYDFPLPEEWSFEVPGGAFCIGGTQPLGLEFTGKISNVEVYNFAATAEQVRIINAGKCIKTNAFAGKYIKELAAPAFEAEILKQEVKSTDELKTILKAVNSATVKATMSDSSDETLEIKWLRVEEKEGKFVAVGAAKVGDLQSAVSTIVEVELPVTIVKAAKGCGGSVAIAGSVISLVTLLGVGLVAGKRKED